MSSSYFRQENRHGRVHNNEDDDALDLLIKTDAELATYTVQGFEEEEGGQVDPDVFDRCCKLEELNLLRRIALVLEGLRGGGR